MREYGGSDQTLENSEGAETECCAENREEFVEGGHGPATLGEDKDDDLSDDQ